MNLKSEARIGIIVIITIALVIWGINYLKGRNILKRTDVFYTVYNNVGGLEKSASIYINGYKIGLINDIHFEKGNLRDIIVSFAVDKEFEIPVGSVAELYNTSPVGGKAIRIVPAVNDHYYSYGDTLPSRIEADLISSIQQQISPLTNKAGSAIESADSLIRIINEAMYTDGKNELKASIENINSLSSSLSNEMGPQGDLHQTLEELAKFSRTLAENREKLSDVFSNLQSITDSLGKANVKKTIETIDKTFEQSSTLLARINEGQGTLGLLATDDSLYNNLKASTQSLDLLLTDLRDHPKRYVHFSIFGKKDKTEKK